MGSVISGTENNRIESSENQIWSPKRKCKFGIFLDDFTHEMEEEYNCFQE